MKPMQSELKANTHLIENATTAHHSKAMKHFDRFANQVIRWVGSPAAFGLAALSIVIWGSLGPFFRYSENWQLVINTGTTIITFLMVFVIQQAQNKDSTAIHLKLNELLAANVKASNTMIGIESLDEEELQKVAVFYADLAKRVKAHQARKGSYSIDENDSQS